jgi:beta-lactamase regulating signal transducer with metallopeptidase domain
MNIESPVFIFLCKWTVLLALGWTAHGLLRSRDARWRLILWRSVLCFGLALPLLQFLPLPAVQVPVDKVAQMVSDTIALPAPVWSAPALPGSAPAASHPVPAVLEVQNPSLIHALHDQWADFFSTLSWSDILLSIWAGGALCGAIRLLRFLDQLSAFRRAAVPANAAVRELTAEVLRRLQIGRSVPVLVSDSAASPFAFGIFRPAIMLPAKMTQSLSSEEMAALLGHEVAHLRRRDLWWCIGWRWMKAIFWFHPLIWKLPDVHSLACEEEADRLASSYMASRASYARVLAQLTLRVLALPEMETELAVNGTAQITHRLHRLQKDLGPWNRKQTVAACFLVLAMASLSVGCDVTSKKNDRQIQALEAKVAELEHRLDQMQGASRQLTPEQQQGRERMQSYHGKFEQRYGLDVRTHTEAKVVEVENAYAATQRDFGSPECIEALKKFIKKYPGFNRTGCALSELAGLSNRTSPEVEQYLKECIQKYDDCYWGDGVQVGPFARFGLAEYYKHAGQDDKAEALYKEIKDNYPDALDHKGQLLIDLINKQ